MPNTEGKVRFGCKRAFYAKKIADGKYMKPVEFEWPKSVDMSDKSSDKSVIYAGDAPRFTKSGGGSRELSVTMTHFGRAFLQDILGQQVDEKGGGVYESAADVMSAFAFGFETSSEQGGYRTWYLECTSSPVTYSPKTNEESLSEVSDSATFTAVEAKLKDGRSALNYTAEPGDADYEKFFDAVPNSDTVDAEGQPVAAA